MGLYDSLLAKAQLRERVRTALLTVNSCALDDESDFERVLDAVVEAVHGDRVRAIGEAVHTGADTIAIHGPRVIAALTTSENPPVVGEFLGHGDARQAWRGKEGLECLREVA